MGSYQDTYGRWQADPENFWAEMAEDVVWNRGWDEILDASGEPIMRWFAGAEMNSCYNAVDRHVEEGRGDQLALIYDSPVTDTMQRFTYRELLEQVSRFAGVLTHQDIAKGDRVLIYTFLLRFVGAHPSTLPHL